MSSNFTLFTNDSGAAGGPIDYVKDAFPDGTVPASNNTGLTDSASTNPLGGFFANDDAVKYGAKILWIKDLTLIDDRSKWVSNKTTYKVNFTENFPGVNAYVYGNVYNFHDNGLQSQFGPVEAAPLQQGQSYIQFKSPGDGFGITGVIRKVAFICNPTTTGTATAQLLVDGANTTTIDMSSVASDASGQQITKYNAYVNSASNQTQDLHDFRVQSIQASTLFVTGVIVYFENSGANIQVDPGVTYVNKSKITTTTGATFAVPTYGSSLGGVGLVYKTQASGYAVSSISATTVSSIAQGSSGTNLATVTTGHGASFPAGSGVVIPQGTSMYVGSVQSVSTDTLTLSPTLQFGVSNLIYRSWLGTPTLSINASLMQLSTTIDFAKYPMNSGFSQTIYDPQGQYAVWGSNVGITLVSNTVAAIFLGASGFLQVDGYFSGAEIENIASGAILNATLSVNGAPTWSVNTGHTGVLKRTIFSEAGPGWNSFVYAPGASQGAIGLNKINLYQRQRDLGVTFGGLAYLETLQATTERRAINATLTALGTIKRVFADQLYLKGSWVRGQTFTAAGGAIYYGASTNSTVNLQYYGKNFALVGTVGSSGTLTLDGANVGVTFNLLQSVATEGFHSLVYTNQAGTAQIQAIDFTRTTSGVKNIQNILPAFGQGATTVASTPSVTTKPLSRIELDTGNGHGSGNTVIRRFSVVRLQVGAAILYQDSSTDGGSFTVQEDGLYFISYTDGQSSGQGPFGLSVNSTTLTTSILTISANERLTMSTSVTTDFGSVSYIGAFRQNDIIRAHTSGSMSYTSNIVKIQIVKLA